MVLTIFFQKKPFHPFAPEQPVITHANLWIHVPYPLYHSCVHQFWRSRTMLSANLCRVKNEHDSVKEMEAREKGKKKKHLKLPKIPTYISIRLILRFSKLFQNLFPLKWSLLIALRNKREKRDKKSERRWKREEGRRESKKKSQDRRVTFKCCFGHIPNVLIRPGPRGISARKSKIAHKKLRRCACAGTCYESCYELINN